MTINLPMLEQILFLVNSVFGGASLIFITYVFFRLEMSDRAETTLHKRQLFDKFKRYDIMKSSLIFLVITHYFTMLGRFIVYFNFYRFFFECFMLLGNLALLVIDYKFFILLRKWVVSHKK